MANCFERGAQRHRRRHRADMCAAFSLLLLSQAVAKLRFDDNVVRSDIDAAIALMRASQASIEPELAKRTREDPVSRLYMVRLQDMPGYLWLQFHAVLVCMAASAPLYRPCCHSDHMQHVCCVGVCPCCHLQAVHGLRCRMQLSL